MQQSGIDTNAVAAGCWRCPLCAGELTSLDGSWRCTSGHSFDQAKEGYLNLLPAHHKRSKAPGDSAEMLAARRLILSSGYYDKLAGAIAAMLPFRAGQRLLDIGCGEGYYLRQLQARGWEPAALAGVDIAKPGVRGAAKRQSQCEFAVASSFRLPVHDQYFDRLLKVFAPADSAEMARILKPGGQLLEVGPGPDHLRSLKQHLYREVRPHPDPSPLAGFTEVRRMRLVFPFVLRGAELVRAFILMTPFSWHGNETAKEALASQEVLHLEADFLLRLLQVDS
ncbi:putative RNA methyltransferase [Biformimicrobium ophioploci]|uniref:23S rRNA (Guanine(745)-N(1))-methyltransferase n=1 Tax=Biformimicrobium ophioploci TaxID=3036711 RepID=A0ABQ6LZ87_9GAMM|nr:methyltransferase domain-containing protein [Microbulbifer sp. NKW57]GMG87408.1 23S rRNA (guanine(745)-N(1))-methyltransferase [Microbulbifer sp. NKW57]